MIFLYLEKAYKKVLKQLVWQKLKINASLMVMYIDVMQEMHEGAIMSVMVERETSMFSVGVGLHYWL